MQQVMIQGELGKMKGIFLKPARGMVDETIIQSFLSVILGMKAYIFCTFVY